MRVWNSVWSDTPARIEIRLVHKLAAGASGLGTGLHGAANINIELVLPFGEMTMSRQIDIRRIVRTPARICCSVTKPPQYLRGTISYVTKAYVGLRTTDRVRYRVVDRVCSARIGSD